jgi:hypothetical protein
MANISEIKVPTISKFFPKKPHVFPISERENLLRALNCEKPLWMPNIFDSSQEAPNVSPGETPKMGEDFTDAFGVRYKFSEAQGSATPVNTVLSGVTEWKKEVVWPDLEQLDVAAAAKGFIRDENLALQTRLFSACFEHLHFLEGFEQALVDLVTEPEACRELFEATVDYYIALFDKKYAVFQYDWVFYNDDWGTAHGPFFSIDTLRETILQPTIRYVKHIRSKGVKVIFHNCGLIDAFVPILVEEVGADALDIQPINDIAGILKRYGDRVTPMLQGPDSFFFYDPDTTLSQVREKARYYVDVYGAHANPGAGAMLMYGAPTEEMYNAFMDEIYEYSMEKYAGLR